MPAADSNRKMRRPPQGDLVDCLDSKLVPRSCCLSTFRHSPRIYMITGMIQLCLRPVKSSASKEASIIGEDETPCPFTRLSTLAYMASRCVTVALL